MIYLKCCDNCISRTHPKTREQFPRWYCSKHSKFVTIEDICALWVSRTFANEPIQLDLIEQKEESIQLTFNFEKERR